VTPFVIGKIFTTETILFWHKDTYSIKKKREIYEKKFALNVESTSHFQKSFFPLF